MIHIKGLEKSFGNKRVLSGIDLNIEEGQFHGIVGKNGSGKTTLFRCLVGLEDFNGSISAKGSTRLKDITGYLPTNPPILSKITGEEYLKLLCIARNVTIDNFQERNIFELPLNTYVETYSTGMVKKLAITGVLLQENKVYILDEPFNGLDYQSSVLLSEILMKLKSLNKTVILTSHIFSTLSQSCDYIHYLQNGTISKSASSTEFQAIEDLMKKELIGNRIENLQLK